MHNYCTITMSEEITDAKLVVIKPRAALLNIHVVNKGMHMTIVQDVHHWLINK